MSEHHEMRNREPRWIHPARTLFVRLAVAKHQLVQSMSQTIFAAGSVPYLRRVFGISVARFSLLCVLGAVLVPAVGRALSLSIPWAITVAVGFLLLVISAVAWQSCRAWRCAALARRRLGCLCVECLYPLPSDGVSGTCPECGRPFTQEENRRLWGVTPTIRDIQ
jgi:hypothetical protein